MVPKLSAAQTAQNTDCFAFPSQVQWDSIYPAETDPNNVFSGSYIVAQQYVINYSSCCCLSLSLLLHATLGGVVNEVQNCPHGSFWMHYDLSILIVPSGRVCLCVCLCVSQGGYPLSAPSKKIPPCVCQKPLTNQTPIFSPSLLLHPTLHSPRGYFPHMDTVILSLVVVEQRECKQWSGGEKCRRIISMCYESFPQPPPQRWKNKPLGLCWPKHLCGFYNKKNEKGRHREKREKKEPESSLVE